MRSPQTLTVLLLLGAALLACRTDRSRSALPPPTPGVPFTNSLGMVMVPIPAGSFLMGSPAQEPGRSDLETQRRVTIPQPFFMGATEVTQQQWRTIFEPLYPPKGDLLKDDPRAVPFIFENAGPNAPAENVTWEQAKYFCQLLSEREGRTYRLPTEQEWEYACRAGTTAAYNTGSTIRRDQANIDFTWDDRKASLGHRPRVFPVGSFRPNAWGLYDMHGNVWEWCESSSGRYPDTDVPPEQRLALDTSRVMRGGSLYSPLPHGRSASRSISHMLSRSENGGFRVVLAPPRLAPGEESEGGMSDDVRHGLHRKPPRRRR